MNVKEFSENYSLYGSVIESWTWAASHRIVAEVDLALFNQPEQSATTGENAEFEKVIVVFDRCSMTDLLDEGFSGFAEGDARVIDIEFDISSPTIEQGTIFLSMMYDAYDGKDEKLVSIKLTTPDISVIAPQA